MLTTILIISVILFFFYYVAVRPLYFWRNRGVKQAPILEVFITNISFGIFQRDVSSFVQSFYNKFPGSRLTKPIMWFVIVGIPVIASLIFYFAIKPLYFWKNQGVKQSSIPKEFISNLFGVFKRENAAIYVQKLYNQYSGFRYCGLYQFYTPMIFLRDPELIKQMLIKDFEHFTDHRPFVGDGTDPLWSKSLFALKGSEWRHMRPILSPSFTSSMMKAMFILMRDCAENFARHFVERDQDLVVIEMKENVTRFCNDVIATTAFGVEVDSLANPDNEFYRMGKKTTDFSKLPKQLRFALNIAVPPLGKLLGVKFFEDDVGTFFSNLIIDTMRERKEKGIIRPDMIHLLMEAQKNEGRKEIESRDTQENILGKEKHMTDEDIIAQALIFFFAGFDTVSTLMCFMAHELAVNPDVQDKLLLEIRETAERQQGKLTYDSLVNMKYLDMVVTESLRKWPSLIGFERICTKPYTIEPVLPDEKPVHLQKGTVIFVPTFGIQHDPNLYPDPERFDPERFSPENKATIESHAYQPFGVGPRNCIGSRYALMEIKVAFFYILSNFEIVPVEKTKIPLVLAKDMFHLGADGGFWLGLKRLKK